MCCIQPGFRALSGSVIHDVYVSKADGRCGKLVNLANILVKLTTCSYFKVIVSYRKNNFKSLARSYDSVNIGLKSIIIYDK